MSLASSLSLVIGLLALGGRTVLAQDGATCLAYGMDFQNGGSYFQNSLSSDNFTFVSQFDGMYILLTAVSMCSLMHEDCQNDVAYNILVDPAGDQTLCSNTQLQPDDTDQLSTWYLHRHSMQA